MDMATSIDIVRQTLTLDSFINECVRRHPVNAAVLSAQGHQGLHFSGNTVLPCGALVQLPRSRNQFRQLALALHRTMSMVGTTQTSFKGVMKMVILTTRTTRSRREIYTISTLTSVRMLVRVATLRTPSSR